jgi:glycosidase
MQPTPGWLRGAVVYGVVPPLFGDAPFQAVTARLDELVELGVDVLWLSPLNATDDPSAISYAVTDYFDVRGDYGTREELRRLVREAKKRGLRVVMDFVPNHTSVGHPFFQDAERKGEASAYHDFYVRDARGEPVHFFDWEGLKNLNYDNPEVQRMMIAAFSYWVREFDIDGFRVDAAWGIRQRNPEFWPRLARELRRLEPDLFLLAEASARDAFYVRNGFHAAYDWTEELGQWAWARVFEEPEQVGARLDEALAARATPPERVARFLNNNDTGERFITRYGPGMTRVAAVLLHTLPGIPIVYTGDEVGAEFEPYEDPPPLSWEDRHHLRALYRRLATLREELPALHSGSFQRVGGEGPPSTFAFLRDAGGARQALVALNFSQAPQRLRVSLPASLRAQLREGSLRDALSGRDVSLRARGSEQYELELRGQSALVLTPQTGGRSGGGPSMGAR